MEGNNDEGSQLNSVSEDLPAMSGTEGKNDGDSQLNSASKDIPRISGKSSCLSQIYLEQWEKKVETEVKDSKHEDIDFSDIAFKNLTQDQPGISRSSSAPSGNIETEQNEKKNKQKIFDDEKFSELSAENKELRESLDHSRRRTRELVKELREERATKRIRREDFNMIQTLLKRYL